VPDVVELVIDMSNGENGVVGTGGKAGRPGGNEGNDGPQTFFISSPIANGERKLFDLDLKLVARMLGHLCSCISTSDCR